MNELIVQSPHPNYIHLFPFPSLPFLLDEGKIKGLSLIGASEIREITWKPVNSRIFVETLVLAIDFSHFWWNERNKTILEKEDRPGLCSFPERIEENDKQDMKKQTVLVSPNSLKVVHSSCSEVQSQSYEVASEFGIGEGYVSTILASKKFLKITTFLKAKNDLRKKCVLHLSSKE
jgi:hypothetical protein